MHVIESDSIVVQGFVILRSFNNRVTSARCHQNIQWRSTIQSKRKRRVWDLRK